jgi:uncharacterized protein (TIGR02284 family)
METRGQSQDLTLKLNHLIALAEDGKFGYESAGKDVKEGAMRGLFFRLSAERGAYVLELQREVTKLGESPKNTGGPVGALHRAWIDLKSALTAGDKNAIIKACITGEEYALKEYQDAIDAIKTEGPLKQILISQRAGIQSALSSIKMHLDK